jgi:RNA polymerase II subunit A-like phosphatase
MLCTMVQPGGWDAITTKLKLKPKLAVEMSRTMDEDRLRLAQKLILVVDLDQTVVHSVRISSRVSMASATSDVHTISLHGGKLHITTKIRPFARKVLLRLAQKYELTVFTLGTREYANEIIAILDPDTTLFGQRILTQTESLNPNHKVESLKQIYPGGQNMVVIMDDNRGVWDSADNLLPVHPFTYFTEQNTVVNADDDALLSVERILMQLHSAFYNPTNKTPTTSFILKQMRCMFPTYRPWLLAECVVGFNFASNETQLHKQVKRICMELGATCVNNYTDKDVTHIIVSAQSCANMILGLNALVVYDSWARECNRTSQLCDFRAHSALPF